MQDCSNPSALLHSCATPSVYGLIKSHCAESITFNDFQSPWIKGISGALLVIRVLNFKPMFKNNINPAAPTFYAKIWDIEPWALNPCHYKDRL